MTGLLVTVLGCSGGYRFAPVSGIITLNGQPLANADVHFQPVATKDNPNPGPGSHGKTDAAGRYTLRVDSHQDGAIIGKHRVMVYAYERDPGPQPDAGGRHTRDRVPIRYNERTQLICDVPDEGKNNADFELSTP